MRKTPIVRHSWIGQGKPRTPIARSPMKKHRRPAPTTLRIYGTPAHREWMKRQPCVICGRTPCDAAHLTNGGTGRKDDWQRTVPLCANAIGRVGHHHEYDYGKRSFRVKYAHVDLEAKARETVERWEAAA